MSLLRHVVKPGTPKRNHQNETTGTSGTTETTGTKPSEPPERQIFLFCVKKKVKKKYVKILKNACTLLCMQSRLACHGKEFPGGTLMYWLYGYVPLFRVWFSDHPSRTGCINHGNFCLEWGIYNFANFTNCLLQGATILPRWELVWLGFDVRDVFSWFTDQTCLGRGIKIKPFLV